MCVQSLLGSSQTSTLPMTSTVIMYTGLRLCIILIIIMCQVARQVSIIATNLCFQQLPESPVPAIKETANASRFNLAWTWTQCI